MEPKPAQIWLRAGPSRSLDAEIPQIRPPRSQISRWDEQPPLTREVLVVFGATGAEASNKVALAAGKELVIEVLGLKTELLGTQTAWAAPAEPGRDRHPEGSADFGGKFPLFLTPQRLLPD